MAYAEGLAHDASMHVLHANSAACHIELASSNYKPKEKVKHYALALKEARACTALKGDWAKGFVRQATAEFELVKAKSSMEKRAKQDAEWKAKHEPDTELTEEEKAAEAALAPEIVSLMNSASLLSCEASCRAGLKAEVPEGAQSATLRTRLQCIRDEGVDTNPAEDAAMRLPEAAAPLKALGNKEFAAKNFSRAAEFYTKALEQDPLDHVFYSNRSG